MDAHNLKKLGFDLAYLSLLTKAGVKPLSRWEKDFGPETEELLHQLGLKTRTVHRSVRSGKRIRELIFSKSDDCLDLYVSRFDGTAIDPSPTNMRIEGLLFGYPSCCVESYVAKGYVKNSFRRSDQRILFHWACPNCPITPLLLTYYREIHGECRKAMQGRVLSALWSVREAVLADHLKRAVATAASLIALGALPAAKAQADGDDLHLIALDAKEDPDADFLTSAEEAILDLNPDWHDEDGNSVPDGVDLAGALSAAIEAMPTEPTTARCYVVHNMAFGVETCLVCGEVVNMGFMEIVNPIDNLTIDVPYVAKHYMEHGSFSYAGGIHTGRLDVPLLRAVVWPEGWAHFIAEPKETDADNDGLRDLEEHVFGTNPHNPDSDGDGLIDGIDLARELRAELDSLPRGLAKDEPYVIEHPMDGIERCLRCGEWVVMGIWDVINPVTGASISIPSMALHFMEHGAFSWEGGYLFGGGGRVDPLELRAVLTGEGNGHLLPVSPDSDGDFLSDDEELDLGRNPENPDEDGNQILDGVELAKTTAAEIAALPAPSPSSEIHRLDFPLRGLERCDICGNNVNMGHLTVVNPVARLYVKVPYIAVHYMEHGSFSFVGDVHGSGRLDVKLLVNALDPLSPSHMVAVSPDGDGDGLSDYEEAYLGTDKDIFDSDNDGVPDGFQLAHGMWEAIKELPRVKWGEKPPADSPYVIEHYAKGLVYCKVCGVSVNMGYMELINPKEGVKLSIPYLALHYMRHGSFSYEGPGRVNPCLLDFALNGKGNSHLVAFGSDKDLDGLLDDEEDYFGTNPGNPDTDGDGILDGAYLARKMHQRVQALPVGENPAKTYIMHYEADCYTRCSVCGKEVNCGHVEITNPLTGATITISYVELHFMEMGSFAASREERVDPILLEAILSPGVVIAASENGTMLRWRGVAGKKYQVFTAPGLSGPWTGGQVLDGDGAELTYTDDGSSNTDCKFYKILAW